MKSIQILYKYFGLAKSEQSLKPVFNFQNNLRTGIASTYPGNNPGFNPEIIPGDNPGNNPGNNPVSCAKK